MSVWVLSVWGVVAAGLWVGTVVGDVRVVRAVLASSGPGRLIALQSLARTRLVSPFTRVCLRVRCGWLMRRAGCDD